MTTTREDRRPEWLRRKHAGPDPLYVREAFKRLVLQALDVDRPIRLSDVAGMTFGTDDEARDEGRLIYNTARALGLSAASRVTDPATGNCELCDGGVVQRPALPAQPPRHLRSALLSVRQEERLRVHAGAWQEA